MYIYIHICIHSCTLLIWLKRDDVSTDILSSKNREKKVLSIYIYVCTFAYLYICIYICRPCSYGWSAMMCRQTFFHPRIGRRRPCPTSAAPTAP